MMFNKAGNPQWIFHLYTRSCTSSWTSGCWRPLYRWLLWDACGWQLWSASGPLGHLLSIAWGTIFCCMGVPSCSTFQPGLHGHIWFCSSNFQYFLSLCFSQVTRIICPANSIASWEYRRRCSGSLPPFLSRSFGTSLVSCCCVEQWGVLFQHETFKEAHFDPTGDIKLHALFLVFTYKKVMCTINKRETVWILGYLFIYVIHFLL